MNPFKKLALTFTAALTLLAGDAMAQCGGKTVYVQIPTEGSWSKTSINILWEGNIRPSVTATAEGTQFVRFTFPTSVPNDGSGKTFSLSMKSTQIDEGNRWIASGSRYNITGNRPTDAQGISCSSFGTGSTLYIYPNPTSATTTVVRTDPPNARYFYFLPPNDKDWILNAPYLWEGNVSTKLEVDPDRCGWYRKVYFSTPPSDNEALILQTPKDAAASSKNKIGVYGMAEDPVDWVDGIPTPIKLKSKFDEVLNCNGCGGDLFFVAEGDKMGWSKTDPMIDERNRCSYGFAARIYDTDAIANTSFFDYDCLSGNSAGTASSIGGGSGDGSGILTGIVKTELSNGKIQWQGTSKSTTSCSGANDGWNQANFEKAFKSTPGSNVVRCYDMPFQRTRDNLWEFDSNKLCSDGTIDLDGTCTATRGKFLGGFFPPELQSRGEGDYSQCPNCDKKRAAQGWVDFKLDDATKAVAISKWCYDRGYLGPSSVTGVGLASSEASRVCTGGAFKDGDFRNGDVPNPSFLTGTSMWQWDDSRDDRIASGLIGTGPVITSTDGWSNKTMTKNELFCFESAPASFTYEKGQEFFFSGDDDIWVFINNKLELDLGGTHLAAPGYINLDNLKNSKLTEGEKYPINIFFCDRRTTMSNVRIKTNLYFAQETGLSLATKDPSVKGDVCLKRSGGGSCADVSGGTSGESLSCGVDINDGLQYYLKRRDGKDFESIIDLKDIGLPGSRGARLNTSNENCVGGNMDSEGHAYILCYGGIKIYNRLGKVQVLVEDISGLAGTWQVWVTHNEDPHPILKVDEFSKEIRVKIVWGQVRTESDVLMDNLHPENSASVIAGQTVKIGFAAAEQDNTDKNKFFVSMDEKGGSPGQSFSITETSFKASGVSNSSLTLCYDPDCNQPADGRTFTIPRLGQPSQGLLVLYAKGNMGAANDAEYVIKANSGGEEFRLKVYQPRMRFVDGSNKIISDDNNRRFSDPSKGGADTDKWVWLGEEIQRTVAAFDPSKDEFDESKWTLCGKLCDGITLRYTADADINKSAYDNQLVDIGEGGLTMEDGIAKLSMAGMTPVEKVKGSDDYDWASVKICGPSRLESTCHEWTKLQFREPPVPFPNFVEIYDRKGGGRGDSLVIVYNSRFGIEGVHDYPSYIEVIWDTDTIGVGEQFNKQTSSPPCQGGNSYCYVFNRNAEANVRFWEEHGLRRGSSADSIIIVRPNYDESFSGERIKTSAGQNSKVISWTTFENPDRPGTDMTTGSSKSITDKIQPIVISATYLGGENCGTRDNPCTDNLVIDLSEPVKLAENANKDAIKTAFAYILKSMNRSGEFKVFGAQQDLPYVRWKGSNGESPKEEGDSTITLTFRAFKTDNDTAFTPIASDSIRFLAGRKSGSENRNNWEFDNVATASESPLVDKNGNYPHPLEWGKLITGKQRFDVKKNLIGSTSGTDEDDDKRKAILDSLYIAYGGDKDRVDTLFCTGKDKKDGKCKTEKPIELLSIPENWTAEDVKKYMPGTVGIVLKPDVVNEVQTFMTNNPAVKNVKASEIKFVASSFYHTNLGNYVVHRGPIELKCDDKIFQYGGAVDCRQSAFGGNNSGLYLAWDLKDAKGRWAGAGAYVQVYDFYWEIEADVGGQKIKSGKLNPYKKIEMYGVKRSKKSSGAASSEE